MHKKAHYKTGSEYVSSNAVVSNIKQKEKVKNLI